MPRVKQLEILVRYGNTGYIVNDLGIGKSPRYELYNINEKKTVKKSNNPLDFDDFMEKIWKKNNS